MQKFHSKIDWWILAFFIAMSGLLLQLLLTMYAKGTLRQNLLFAVVYALTIVLIWWPVLNTRYVIDKDTLLITCLFLKWRIPLSSIQKVTKTLLLFLGENSFQIFVTIINDKRTGDKQLIADKQLFTLLRCHVYANKHLTGKYKKQPLHFLLQLVVYSAALTFVVAL